MISHWLLDSIEERRASALNAADRAQVYRELKNESSDLNHYEVANVASILEMAVLDLEPERLNSDDPTRALRAKAAADAFRLLRMLPIPKDQMAAATHLLRASALAVIGDRSPDAARWLRSLDEEGQWPNLPVHSDDWGIRCRATLTETWLRLIRKRGWEDRDAVLEQISALREHQDEFENNYLSAHEPDEAKHLAVELIAIYHLAKAADILAHFMTDGVVEGNYQVQTLLDLHFDRASQACRATTLIELGPLTHLLEQTAAQMVANSLWTVTRAVNSKVTDFVRELVSRGRGNKALFEVLPPQRYTLAEKGLLGSSRRAVVVSLPTSSGKTLIAQFRILQALNQFENEQGWVAYVAPTRALVNQVYRQFRRDFGPLGIVVERVSPALDIDSIEADLLQAGDEGARFRVLVATPEKFDLMLRQGWEEKIGRPLTLVIVDEAHNLQDKERGLKQELLLSTINRECQYAQFLLLTPFIKNATEIAQWLGGTQSDDISLRIDWQPNDRVVGIVHPVKTERIKGRSYHYALNFETVQSSRPSIVVDDTLSWKGDPSLANTFAKAKKSLSPIAAMTAKVLKERGPVIVMHSGPQLVWKLAQQLKPTKPLPPLHTSERIRFVQDYIREELGADFPLIDLLSHRIGVHHAGLPEEVRILMEWLFEESELEAMAATTTIAQGVNFPVSGVVMAAINYPFGEEMPPEDFWNIAGRAGRISQGQLGVVTIVAKDEEDVGIRREFIQRNTAALNSSLIKMALDAQGDLGDLGTLVFSRPEWSSFLQYLTHSYRQMGKPAHFVDQIEQVLRGTLGFEKLRSSHNEIAQELLGGVRVYARKVMRARNRIALVDSTGFSLEGVGKILSQSKEIPPSSWNQQQLFADHDGSLKKMMGVLLRVPELRIPLKNVLGGNEPDGTRLALILKDWVNGQPLSSIAARYFKKPDQTQTDALTKCGQDLFGKLTHSATWGLGALLTITTSSMTEEERKRLSNIPSHVFYGVNTDEAVMLRMLGVPRSAAPRLAHAMGVQANDSLSHTRQQLEALTARDWTRALGDSGHTYHRVWRILDGAAE